MAINDTELLAALHRLSDAGKLKFKFKLRRDTAANWAAKNPTPLDGEPCLETDTGRRKVGDGETEWNDLLYQMSGRTIGLDAIQDGQGLAWSGASKTFIPSDMGRVYQAGTGVAIDDPNSSSPTINAAPVYLDGIADIYDDLPDPPAAGEGAAYVVAADNRVYVYNGTSWPEEGKGILISGGNAAGATEEMLTFYLTVDPDSGPNADIVDLLNSPTTVLVMKPAESWNATADLIQLSKSDTGNDPEVYATAMAQPTPGVSILQSGVDFTITPTSGGLQQVQLEAGGGASIAPLKIAVMLTEFDVDSPEKYMGELESNDPVPTSDWTSTVGTLLYRYFTVGSESRGAFIARDPECIAYQDYPIPEGKFPLPEDAHAALRWWETSFEQKDMGQMVLAALDQDGNELARAEYPVRAPAAIYGNGNLDNRQLILQLPAASRRVRVIYHNVRVAGTDSNYQVGNIECGLTF